MQINFLNTTFTEAGQVSSGAPFLVSQDGEGFSARVLFSSGDTVHLKTAEGARIRARLENGAELPAGSEVTLVPAEPAGDEILLRITEIKLPSGEVIRPEAPLSSGADEIKSPETALPDGPSSDAAAKTPGQKPPPALLPGERNPGGGEVSGAEGSPGANPAPGLSPRAAGRNPGIFLPGEGDAFILGGALEALAAGSLKEAGPQSALRGAPEAEAKAFGAPETTLPAEKTPPEAKTLPASGAARATPADEAAPKAPPAVGNPLSFAEKAAPPPADLGRVLDALLFSLHALAQEAAAPEKMKAASPPFGEGTLPEGTPAPRPQEALGGGRAAERPETLLPAAAGGSSPAAEPSPQPRAETSLLQAFISRALEAAPPQSGHFLSPNAALSAGEELPFGGESAAPRATPGEKAEPEGLPRDFWTLPEFEKIPPKQRIALENLSKEIISDLKANGNHKNEAQKLLDFFEKLFAKPGALPRESAEGLKKSAKEADLRLAFLEDAVRRSPLSGKEDLPGRPGSFLQGGTKFESDRFYYLQIPLYFDQQKKAAELFVYRRKDKNKKIDPQNTSILLALQTENLGRVETLLSVREKEISLKLETERERAVPFMRERSAELYRLFSAAGFKLTSALVLPLVQKTTLQNAEKALEELFLKDGRTLDVTI